MFKMPTEKRVNDIVDMIPEMISVLSNNSKGYGARISKMGEILRLDSLANELGIKYSLSDIPDDLSNTKKCLQFLCNIIELNKIPDFALVDSSIGRMRLSFSENGETPIVSLVRKFPKECIYGKIYAYSRYKLSHNNIKRMKSSGAISYLNIKEKTFGIL